MTQFKAPSWSAIRCIAVLTTYNGSQTRGLVKSYLFARPEAMLTLSKSRGQPLNMKRQSLEVRKSNPNPSYLAVDLLPSNYGGTVGPQAPGMGGISVCSLTVDFKQDDDWEDNDTAKDLAVGMLAITSATAGYLPHDLAGAV